MGEIYSFGEWVRRRRKALDLTQDALARRVGCALSMVRKIEIDERRPSRQVAELLADALAVPAVEREQFLRTARAELAPDRLTPPVEVLSPEPATAPPRTGNLPLALTSFIGREVESATVAKLLATQRLVTLTGVGGTGKTRLALQVAAAAQASFPHGAWLVELAPLTDPALVPQTVASALGLREEAGRSIQNVLTDFLSSRTLLLLLDNCEHLIDACAQLAETLLRTCPQIRLLASSREALGVAGEVSFRVPPLRTPDPRQLPDLAAFGRYEAVRLFTERATAALAGFQVTEANMTAIAQVCARLDGIPLAIELAAARVRALRVEQIAARLDDRFRLLTGASRTALPRQQTLRALIDWSYELLMPPEQQLLQRLAVCMGGWRLETAEAIGVDLGEDSYAVLDLLTRLVDKSLVQVDRAVGSEARYTMLETIRQYALERLAVSGMADTVRRRHAEHFLHWIEATQPHLRGLEQRTWLDQLELEHDNLRAALEWSLGGGDAELGAQLVCLLAEWPFGEQSGFWMARGYSAEGLRWLEKALEHHDRIPLNLRAWVQLRRECVRERSLGLFDETPLNETLELFTVLGDRAGIACTTQRKGSLAWLRGDFAGAESLQSASLALFRELGDRQGIAVGLQRLGDIDCSQGDTTRAFARMEESLALRRAMGDSVGIAGALTGLGEIAYRQGNLALAQQYWFEAVEQDALIAERYQRIWPLRNLGWLALDRGDDGEIVEKLAHYVEDYRVHGPAYLAAILMPLLAGMVSSKGDGAWARALLYEALTGYHQHGATFTLRGILILCAKVAADHGDLLSAARILGAEHAAELNRHGPYVQHVVYKRYLAAIRAALGDVAFDAAFAEGAALTLEDALAEALKLTGNQAREGEAPGGLMV